MNQHEPRTLGYYASSNWFHGTVVFVVFGLLAIGILNALDEAMERAEEHVVAQTLRNMQMGLRLAQFQGQIHKQAVPLTAWAGQNPVQWLAAPPTGYRGECSAEESRHLSGGEWCFEVNLGELVYRPKNDRHLRWANEEHPEGKDNRRLRWKVTSRIQAGVSVPTVEKVTSYAWFQGYD